MVPDGPGGSITRRDGPGFCGSGRRAARVSVPDQDLRIAEWDAGVEALAIAACPGAAGRQTVPQSLAWVNPRATLTAEPPVAVCWGRCGTVWGMGSEPAPRTISQPRLDAAGGRLSAEHLAESNSFVGRATELHDIRRMLSRHRVVILTGTGGSGKSRLARRAAVRARRSFPDGVWLIELAALQDPGLLDSTVCAAFGLREQAGTPPRELLREYLGHQKVLLVLDNCEHLVVPCAELAWHLARSCPRLRILATSRELLGVPGEFALVLAPLAVPDPDAAPEPSEPRAYEAVSLFVDRARAAHPPFRLTEDNWDAVATICRRLDGLPLAIELAAAQVATLEPQQVLERLNDRLGALAAGSVSVLPRQQTLRSCIAWSFELCTPAEQLLWSRLSVFPGGFDLETAEAVGAGGMLAREQVLRLVSSLVDKSVLVLPDTTARLPFRMLETVREYGAQKLRDSGEQDRLLRRYADWYGQLVRTAEADLLTARQADWQARLDAELPNIRVARDHLLAAQGDAAAPLEMALALHAYWIRGRLTEGRQWFERALEHQSGPATPSWVRALYHLAMIAGYQGDIAAGKRYAARAQMVAGSLGDHRSRVLAEHAAANIAVFAGDLADAFAGYERVLPSHEANGDLPRLLEALIGVVFVGALLGDAGRSMAAHERIMDITEPSGEVWYRSHSLCDVGLALWRRGDRSKAGSMLRQAVELTLPMDDWLTAALSVEGLAWTAADVDAAARSATLLGASNALFERAGVRFEKLDAFHENCERRTRRALGEVGFQAAYERGRRLDFARAVQLALADDSDAEPLRDESPDLRR